MAGDMPSYLDRFELIALDMNGTFMFGEDRFGPAEDLAATFRTLSALPLLAGRIDDALRHCLERLSACYHDPLAVDDFPTVAATMAELPETQGMAPAALQALEATLAAHELGAIPPDHAAMLRHLSQRLRLALLSNLWSAHGPWLDAFAGGAATKRRDSSMDPSRRRAIAADTSPSGVTPSLLSLLLGCLGSPWAPCGTPAKPQLRRS